MIYWSRWSVELRWWSVLYSSLDDLVLFSHDHQLNNTSWMCDPSSDDPEVLPQLISDWSILVRQVGRGGDLTYLHLPENPMKVFHLLTWYSVTINTLQWRFVEGDTKQKITPKLWILRQDKNRSVLDLFLWNYGCWTYEVHTMSLIWRVIVAISQTMEKKSFPGRAESSDMLWTFRLFTTVHNVFFVQF